MFHTGLIAGFLAGMIFIASGKMMTMPAALAIFAFPPQRNLTAHLAATGSISDDTFRVFIDKWTQPDDYRPVGITCTGASFSSAEGTFVLSEENWQLLDALQQLRLQQRQTPGETVNQTSWAKIRRQAKSRGKTG